MCIDPYRPKLSGYSSLLVVDGLITDANTSYSVKLTRTFTEQSSVPVFVPDASVSINDNSGNSFKLDYRGSGIYKTDSTECRGIIGRTYFLDIITSDGNHYQSAPEMMKSVPDIDRLYFDRDQSYTNNATQILNGIDIFIDSKGDENNIYYRWDFEETWKFKIPEATKQIYIDSSLFISIKNPKEYCWKSHKGQDIIIREIHPGEPASLTREQVLFVPSDKSDRLLLNYSILVKQYSISKEDYIFWDNLKHVNEIGGDIFAALPYSVISNIKNIKHSNERVLGYFSVSAVKEKRIFIGISDIVKMDLPLFDYSCLRKEDSPRIKPWTDWKNPPLTWDDLYKMYTTSGYAFVEALFDPGTNELYRMIFTKPECANCELTGTPVKPIFWKD